MMRPWISIAIFAASLGLVGCDDDGSELPDLSMQPTADMSGAVKDLSNADLAAVTLKVFSYMSRCSVSVEGAAATTDAVQTFVYPPASVVNLSATPKDASVVFHYWFATDGDVNMVTHDTHATTTVTLNTTSGNNATVGDRLVQACCVPAGDPSAKCPPPTN